jgi:hypothetical protein
MIVSIFNDVIGPVMRGPSGSHCAAALRIGRLARALMDEEFTDVLVEFDRNGSLPTTHETQGKARWASSLPLPPPSPSNKNSWPAALPLSARTVVVPNYFQHA